MSVIQRSVRNAFRNTTRTISIVVILGLSIGLSLTMLLAHQAVEAKIKSVKANVGNTITVSPAGVRGFEGGGNPLTESDIAKISSLPHVTSVVKSLNDRLTTSDTNLQSAVDAGQLGQRFSQRSGESFGGGFGGFQGSGGSSPQFNFTPPVTVNGTTDPTNLSTGPGGGGGTFKLTSGQVFKSDSNDNVAIIGNTLASKNNLKVGSTFTAYGQTISVIGIFDAGNTFTNNQVIMPLKTVQTLSGQSGDITSATVKVDSVTSVDSVTAAAKQALGSAADVTNDNERAQNAVQPLQNISSISLYSLFGAIIAGSAIILLTMIMIVRERRREIGVLKAIGASNVKVVAQFAGEAVTLTAMAAVVGIVLGVIASNPITHMLVSNSNNDSRPVSLVSGNAGGPRPFARSLGFARQNLTAINANVGWDIVVYGLIAALVIAIVASVAASYVIAKIRPAEVMRND